MSCHQDERPVRHNRSRWVSSRFEHDQRLWRWSKGASGRPKETCRLCHLVKIAQRPCVAAGGCSQHQERKRGVCGRPSTILVRDEVYGAGSSLRRQARSHLSQDRCAFLRAEVMEKIRQDNEIKLASPIHLESISPNRAEALTDASVSGVGRRQPENARPIHSRYDCFREGLGELDAIEPVPRRHVQYCCGG